MLDLELLKTFVCVADEGSFTRAAERVHRTQSTVSQQVRKLEELVGHALLLRDRTGQNISVTEHGEMLIHYARRLLALSSEAVEALASDLDLEILRIGVPEDFDARRMAVILAGFNRARPEARLETVSGMSTDLKQKLAVGTLDIALVKREPDCGGRLGQRGIALGPVPTGLHLSATGDPSAGCGAAALARCVWQPQPDGHSGSCGLRAGRVGAARFGGAA
jgi:DNA-binding transcriptional LysR family regulator